MTACVLFCTLLADREAMPGHDGSSSARVTPVQRGRYDEPMSRMDLANAGGRLKIVMPKCSVHRDERTAYRQPHAALTGELRPVPRAFATYPDIPVADPRPLVCKPRGKAFSAMQETPHKPKRKKRCTCDGPPPSRCCGICETEFDESQFEAMSPPRRWR